MRTVLLMVLAALASAADLDNFIFDTRDSTVRAIATDRAGNIFVAGEVRSRTFTFVRSLQENGGLYLMKLDAATHEVVFATRLGSHEYQDVLGGIALDGVGNVFVCGSTPTLTQAGSNAASGRDGFVIKVRSDGSGIDFMTSFGGSADDLIQAVAPDGRGGVFIAGVTNSPDLPVLPGAVRWRSEGSDGFLARFTSSGRLEYSTYIGAPGYDEIASMTLLSDGSPAVLVKTTSADFPGVLAPTNLSVSCAVKLDSALSHFDYSWCLEAGAGAQRVTAGSDGSLWLTGASWGRSIPVTADAWQRSHGGSAYFRPGEAADATLPASILNQLAVSPSAPQRFYAATERGLFTSGDAGDTWQAADGGLPAFVQSIATDDTSVYALAGAHLFRSADAGANWQLLRDDPLLGGRVLTIATHPRVPGLLFAGGVGVERSDDGGHTWTASTWPSPASVVTIVGDPHQPDVAYAGTTAFTTFRFGPTYGGIFRSTDGGRTFEPTSIQGTGVRTITADASRPGMVYAASDTAFFRSEDFGQTWSAHPSFTPDYPWDITALATDPAAPSVLWAIVREGGVYRSTDGGLTFDLHADSHSDHALTLISVGGRLHAGGALGGDAFLLRLSARGEVEYGTYLGGDRREDAEVAAGDGSGGIYIAGYSFSREVDGSGITYLAHLSGDGREGLFQDLGSYRMNRITALATDPAGRLLIGGVRVIPASGESGYIERVQPVPSTPLK